MRRLIVAPVFALVLILSGCDVGMDGDIHVGSFRVLDPVDGQLVASKEEADPQGTDKFLTTPVKISFTEPEVTGLSSAVVSYYMYIGRSVDWRNLSWPQRLDGVNTQRYLLGVSEYSSGASVNFEIHQELDSVLVRNIIDTAFATGRIQENSFSSGEYVAFTWNVVAEVVSAIPGSAPVRGRAISPDRSLYLWPADSSFDLYKQ